MNYEEKYKQALEHARVEILANPGLRKMWEEIFPELAESEDEGIRKWIIGYAKGQIDGFLLVDDEECNKIADQWRKAIAYLEKQKEPHIPWYDLQKSKEAGYTILKTEEYEELIKQKEQKPLSTEETELNAIAFLSQMGYTCIPPKKEHQRDADAPKNALGGALNSPLDKDKNLDDIAQDYVEAVKEYNPEPTWNLMQTAVCYGYHYREEEEQRLAEWSEFDEDCLKRAIWYVKNPAPSVIKDSRLALWLNTLRSRFFLKPQPKAEWSEEDEKMIERLIRHTKEEFNELCNDRYGHQEIISDLKESCRERMNWLENRLKSLRPSWKPSEEQMRALSEAVSTFDGYEESDAIKSLYNDLKKLM